MKEIDALMEKLLKEVDEILYTEDRISKTSKVDSIIKILEDHYDI